MEVKEEKNWRKQDEEGSKISLLLSLQCRTSRRDFGHELLARFG